MRIIKGLWIFYRKLIIPSLALSILIAFFEMGFTGSFASGTGIAYIFLAPFFHYIIYETTKPKEYYFYYNLGLSKPVLWISTVTISTVSGLLLMLL